MTQGAPQTLGATPDWERPVTWLGLLSAYVQHAPDDAGHLLHLDAGDALPGQVVAQLITTACELLSGGRPFADIDLHGAGQRPPAAVPVADRAALAAALGLDLPALAGDAPGIVAHARWAKQVVDRLQHVLDAWRFEATPSPVLAREPLVSVRIPTWGDVDELMTRTLPSVLNGSWGNLEVVVCSDGPQPHARAAVESVPDMRVRYVELAERPAYPQQPYSLWRVGGAHAVNHAVAACRGDFICPLDHDDAFTHDHIPRLLEAVARTGADMVYGQAVGELRTGPWYLCGTAPLTEGQIAHGAVMLSRRVAHVHCDPLAWLCDEPADWNMWRRIRDLGARVEFVPTPVLVHFKQRTSIEDDPNVTTEDLHGDPQLDVEWAARDVLHSEARELLDVCMPAGVIAGVTR